jgi:hypothetical protein
MFSQVLLNELHLHTILGSIHFPNNLIHFRNLGTNRVTNRVFVSGWALYSIGFENKNTATTSYTGTCDFHQHGLPQGQYLIPQIMMLIQLSTTADRSQGSLFRATISTECKLNTARHVGSTFSDWKLWSRLNHDCKSRITFRNRSSHYTCEDDHGRGDPNKTPKMVSYLATLDIIGKEKYRVLIRVAGHSSNCTVRAQYCKLSKSLLTATGMSKVLRS